MPIADMTDNFPFLPFFYDTKAIVKSIQKFAAKCNIQAIYTIVIIGGPR